MIMTVIKAIFAFLVALPVIYLAYFLFDQVVTDAASTSPRKKPKFHKVLRFLNKKEKEHPEENAESQESGKE